jgi:hypothetical protein
VVVVAGLAIIGDDTFVLVIRRGGLLRLFTLLGQKNALAK